jgi:hypothetical protein
MGGKSVKRLMACICHPPSEVSEASVPRSRKATLGTYDLEAGALGAICSAKVKLEDVRFMPGMSLAG